ncbi:MAG: hypothetical protein CLLPBCKN_007140 [Chroococcidiopsis cubana SAG 39.79]|uniref:Uncharacterized protein n=1 Tax=Chroococcidiopsis cubana SAG 39.79 TaxID=388085 RepID=A0AB37UB45_9CYAN|nr:hypothetical protein [Chroococcidiopsis cubana]MDZ4877705.1 hypothetical protein [Chroococcidiopsis cubana SAG 39.79]PSB60344.1 hypothetical protein C7B79_26065 [Chroococcidiopsis cubana CCALA 043]RUT02668.1 hypothetical protein DSM107010_62080 [Chroococcidiopsis cubana SAG 39.79]
MASMTPNPEALDLKAGPSWSSFEQFRSQGAKALDSVRGGAIATLQTKTGQYRILAESDFQALLGLARDAERLRVGLRVVVKAVRVVQNHPDSDSLSLLSEAVAVLGELPELPARGNFTPLAPEGLEVEEDLEVILDGAQISRPLDLRE